MAYVADDLKPTRPQKVSPNGVVPPVAVSATRAGDDDIRPPRPPENVLKQRAQQRVQTDKASASVADSPSRSTTRNRERVVGGVEYGLLKLMAYACGAIVAIWLLGSLGSVLHSVAIAASLPEKILFGLIFLIEVSIVLYVIHYAKKTFARLPEITQMHRRAYNGSQQALATDLKSKYIRQFPKQQQYVELSGFGPGDEALSLLARLRDHDYADSVGFMNDYDRFQQKQDERALEIIKKYATLIGIKTAASPWKSVDVIAVFFNSTLMVVKIADVYHRQMSRPQAFRLVFRWCVNLYISGELGQIAEAAADEIAQGTASWLGEAGISAILQPAVPLLSKFGGKLAEGGVNAYLAYRLGCRACESFRELVD